MQTPHILIVEDELVTRNTLKSIFEAEGYDVFEATDGAEMHQILSENDINLVILSLIHISEPTRLGMISYAVFCLKKKKQIIIKKTKKQ